MLERVHPARPGWYEKLYATALDKGMASYEAEVHIISLYVNSTGSYPISVSYLNELHNMITELANPIIS
jgi:hypothetical protein